MPPGTKWKALEWSEQKQPGVDIELLSVEEDCVKNLSLTFRLKILEKVAVYNQKMPI